jgi:hypothetical protein
MQDSKHFSLDLKSSLCVNLPPGGAVPKASSEFGALSWLPLFLYTLGEIRHVNLPKRNLGISLILGNKSQYFSLISLENGKIILLYMYISLDWLHLPRLYAYISLETLPVGWHVCEMYLCKLMQASFDFIQLRIRLTVGLPFNAG